MNGSALTPDERPFKRAGASLEQAVRRIRSYLLPSHLWTYWKVVRQHASVAEITGGPFVFFDFSRVEIDNETGRYVFALVREFEALGFQICYRKNFRFLATMRHKLFKRMLLERPFHVCDSLEELPPDSVAVIVTDRCSRPLIRSPTSARKTSVGCERALTLVPKSTLPPENSPGACSTRRVNRRTCC